MTPIALLGVVSGVGVAGANGANDNAKGVATLVGANVLAQGRALWLGHVATFAGAVASVWVAGRLIDTFQGGGFLPADLAGTPGVLWVIGAAAAATIFLATLLRLPISTTHALAGALVGISIAVTGTVPVGPLMAKFIIPLAASPLLSAMLAATLFFVGRGAGRKIGWDATSCLCVQAQPEPAPVVAGAGNNASITASPADLPLGALSGLSVAIGSGPDCAPNPGANVMGVSVGGILNSVHLLSAVTVSAARGLNDAPKLAALLVGLTAWWTAGPAVMVVAVAMLLGGWLGARRIVQTMAERITDMTPGSAVAANLVASGLVILASFVAMPVSTTHVTCGALFGIGAVGRGARWAAIRTILLAWIVTLPLSAAIAALLSRISIGWAG